jgi:hypothetical protein
MEMTPNEVSMTKGPSKAPLRRSARVSLRIPVTVLGKLADGRSFQEEASILTVSKFGAKLKTSLPLSVGAEVKVRPKMNREAALFRVVWVGRPGSPREGEIGIEYAEVSNLLGISFPE